MTTIADPTTVTLPELLQHRVTAKQLSLSSGVKVQTDQAGGRRSAFRGRGIDFDEFRAYQAGDDIRDIDWRVTARSGKAHIKVFKEERERPVLIIADLGSRQFFASQQAFKSVLTCHIAAVVGWAAVENGDRVGCLISSEASAHKDNRPRGNRPGALRLCKQLEEQHESLKQLTELHGNTTDDHLNCTLASASKLAKPGSLICIISDFGAWNDESEQYLRRLKQHCEVICLQLLDPLDLSLPKAGLYPAESAQHKGVIDSRGDAQRQQYQQESQALQLRVERYCAKTGCDYLQLTTAQPIVEQLKAALNKRGRVR